MVEVDGDLDEVLLEKVEAILAKGFRGVLIDLKLASDECPALLNLLLRAFAACAKQRRVFGICRPPEKIVSQLLDKDVPLYPTRMEGLLEVGKLASGSPAPVAAGPSTATREAPQPRPESSSDDGDAEESEDDSGEHDTVVQQRPGDESQQFRLELENRVRPFIANALKSMSHLKVLEQFAIKHIFKGDPKGLAARLGENKSRIKVICDEFVKLNILKPLKTGAYRYEPSDLIKAQIADFQKLWKNPTTHSKVLSWIYETEEQTKKSVSESGIFRRLFLKE